MTASLVLLLAMLAVDSPAASAKLAEQLQAIHLAEARKWHIYLDENREDEATLLEKPIYIWTNPTRADVQHGEVYLWTHRGRPVAVGSIFSHPEKGRRMICQEYHSLAESVLAPGREGTGETWQPLAPVSMQPLTGAPAPDASPARRLIQMRSLAREFTAHSIDYQQERWELRLLAQPLFRYEKPDGDVVDGALFAFVTSAGTDPEVILALEARKSGDRRAWYYRAVRFSDSSLYVQYAGKDAWSSVRDDKNQLHHNADHTYRLIRDRYIDELPAVAPTRR